MVRESVIVARIVNEMCYFVKHAFTYIFYKLPFVKTSTGNVNEPQMAAQDFAIESSASDVTALRLVGIWAAAQLFIGIGRDNRDQPTELKLYEHATLTAAVDQLILWATSSLDFTRPKHGV